MHMHVHMACAQVAAFEKLTEEHLLLLRNAMTEAPFEKDDYIIEQGALSSLVSSADAPPPCPCISTPPHQATLVTCFTSSFRALL